MDWEVLGLFNVEDNYKNVYRFFCEIECMKKLEVSKSKLPDYFHDLFGKK